MSTIDVTLAVLCGGKAKRLGGVPKGLLQLEGRAFIERLLALRMICADALLISSDGAPYEQFGARIVPDLWVSLGAPGAVHTALCAARTEWVFAVAADMPFMTMSALLELWDARSNDVEVVAAEVDGLIEPLGALYRKSLSEAFAQRLEEEPSPSLVELIGSARSRKIRPGDPRAYTNVNTQAELQASGATRPVGW